VIRRRVEGVAYSFSWLEEVVVDEHVEDVGAEERSAWERQARWWEYSTLAWNGAEAAISIAAGAAAHSAALVAFGLDSCVEVFASLVVLWSLRRDGNSRDSTAVRLIGVAFAAVAAFLVADAVSGIANRHRPRESMFGIGFMALTVVVMFTFAWGKNRAGERLANQPLKSNARMAILDGCLAAAVLVSLALNSWLGWWWADAVATLIVAIAAANEAREAFTGDID
jgi:divalent metal cation (Fe/Co/Zn/Cd) transporter